MRFMMFMIPKGYETAAPGTLPELEDIRKMSEYNESLQKAGVLLALDGLHPPSMGVRIRFPEGKPVITDGPFAEAKEAVGGYWILQVASRAEAVEWASRCPGNANETIELRPFMEFSDFPADVRAGMADIEAFAGEAPAP